MEKIQEALSVRPLGQTEEDVLRNLGYIRKIDNEIQAIFEEAESCEECNESDTRPFPQGWDYSKLKPSAEDEFKEGPSTHDYIAFGKERHTGSIRFHQILTELGELHDRKQRDYGTDTDPFANVRASQELNLKPWVGAMLRANDKMARIKTFVMKGELYNESLEDSFRDLAVYAIIALVLWEEEERLCLRK